MNNLAPACQLYKPSPSPCPLLTVLALPCCLHLMKKAVIVFNFSVFLTCQVWPFGQGELNFILHFLNLLEFSLIYQLVSVVYSLYFFSRNFRFFLDLIFSIKLRKKYLYNISTKVENRYCKGKHSFSLFEYFSSLSCFGGI